MANMYEKRFFGKSGIMDKDKQITYEQFIDNIKYQKLTGHKFK